VTLLFEIFAIKGDNAFFFLILSFGFERELA